MGLPDLNTFIKSLKVLWIKRTKNTKQTWNEILIRQNPDFQLIFKVGPLIATRLSESCRNIFWKDVFSAFMEFAGKVMPKTESEFLSSSFLYNDNIKIGVEAITYRYLLESNMYNISCLKREGRFRDLNNFKETFPDTRINFVTYNGIIKAICQYRNRLKLKQDYNTNQTLQPHIKVILSSIKGTKPIKDVFASADSNIKSLITWGNRLNTDIDKIKVFRTLLNSTSDTNLRWFQFRIIHNILTTNRSVAKYDPGQDEQCSFCLTFSESIEHLFWNCRFAQTFWTNLTVILKEKCSHTHNLRLTKQLVILGFDDNIKTDEVLDLIILIAKHYIYRSKVRKIKPNFTVFLPILKTRHRIENTINANHLQSQFKVKWAPYITLIS